MLLPITLTAAGAAALLNIWLGLRVARVRGAHKVLIGDGGNPAVIARMRAHANFTEYAPFFLILLGLVEMAAGSATWLWGAAIVFILARILHAFGMDRPTLNPLRGIGIGLTLLTLLILAGYAIFIAYGAEREGGMTLVPVTQSAPR